jgi:Flp pilus assembly protein TadD
MNPAAEESYRVLGLTLALHGQYEDAERVLREATGLAGAGTYTNVTLAYALAMGGRRDFAAALLEELEEKQRLDYVSPVELATLNIGLGNIDKALDWADHALDERRGWMAYLKVHPIVDPLRGDPRFSALVDKMGLS